MQTHVPLPIDPFLPDLVDACRSHAAVIVKAEPGAGKTTRLPRALLDHFAGKILVLEPRRLAARLSAERVAREYGETIGHTIGYQMRFASECGRDTRLIYITEGLFLRLLQGNPTLDGVSLVILDEFHERHIHSDIALAMVRLLQTSHRPDLRLVIMSATVDTDLLAQHLSPAQVFDIPGRTFPVVSEYLGHLAQIPVEDAVCAALEKMLDDPRCPENILVFLTGIQEIRRCQERLSPLASARGIDVFGLTAELPLGEQQRIFAAQARRMIVLATNVAETSVTLPNITGVIDTGRAKIPGMAPWSGMPTLDIKPISQASAIQRMGRAGRTAPGVAYRLYSESDFRARPAFLAPEIKRLDLTPLCLEVMNLCDTWRIPCSSIDAVLPWLDRPEERAVAQSMRLLRDLGAVDSQGRLTPEGREMARFPLHPRLARTFLAGLATNSAHDVLLVACLISEGFVVDRSPFASARDSVSLTTQLNFLRENMREHRNTNHGARSGAPFPRWIAAQRVRQVASLYRAIVHKMTTQQRSSEPIDRNTLGQVLLAGFPDRVGKLRPVIKDSRPSGKDGLLYNLVGGGGGILAADSEAKSSPWILVLEAEESSVKNADQAVNIRTAISIDTDILRARVSPYVTQRTEAVWADDAQRVDVMERTYYGSLMMEESRIPVKETHKSQVQNVLLTKLKDNWPKPFSDDLDLKTYHVRASLISALKHTELPLFEGEMLELLLADICHGHRTFKEIAARPLKAYLEDQLSWEEKSTLDSATPLTLRLENGRSFAVHYEPSRPPYLTGYVQDFFGVKTSPSLFNQALTLTIELCGPNKRPLQVTSDLPGFWRNVYPKLRGELGRTYPKHYWPEQPESAEPHLLKSRAKNTSN